MNSFVSIENLLSATFNQLGVRFDHAHNMLWTFMASTPRPCFTEELLKNLSQLGSLIAINEGQIPVDGKFRELDYLVIASKMPGVFNLGGDLSTFRECILAGDRYTLTHYAKLCIDVIDMHLNHFHNGITTISLVQGQALGGGLEFALTSDIIVAERSAKMGFPEILFNLFPGMGALSLLSRRIGLRKAEEMCLSGNMYSAEQLLDMGVVDILAEDGEGENAVYRWVQQNKKQRNGYQAIQRAKSVIQPVTRKELTAVTDIWVEAALKLTDRDLKLMDRLVRAQNKRSIEQPVSVDAIAA